MSSAIDLTSLVPCSVEIAEAEIELQILNAPADLCVDICPTSDSIEVSMTGVGIQGPSGPPGSGSSVVTMLDSAGFNGSSTTFVDLLPAEPDLNTYQSVMLMQSGIGVLQFVTGIPVAGQFVLSGATNRAVTFGFAPESGDFVYAIFVAA
jgi:hypothetical protein|tara:strand:+ start:603 stop:1052 length:450 start_codon:yes stop_codon:yes gene_type:complete